MSDTEELFQKTYISDMRLPWALEQKAHIVSRLSSHREGYVCLLEDDEGRRSILKTAWGSQAEFLEAEAASFRKLELPFLPKIYSFFHEGNSVFLWREYIDGDTLWEKVEREGPLDAKQAAEIIKRVCSLISQLHDRVPSVIHRDLKPQNFVLTEEGNLFLIDMETVRTYREDAEYDTFFIGTRQTAAPEQYGYRQTDCRTDIYAIGILFLYLLTGSTDLQRSSLLNSIPEAYREVIETSTRLDPDERYQSCEKLEEAVSLADDLVARGWSFGKLRTWKIARRAMLAAACLCVLCAAGVWHFRGLDRKYYHFKEPVIEQAVCLKLGKEPGTITRADLEQITELRICGDRILEDSDVHYNYFVSHGVWSEFIEIPIGDPVDKITTVEDCAGMKNLNTLILDKQSVMDLSPLAGLPLQILSLGESPVTDLSALSDSKKLIELDLFETRVRDITPLSGLSELAALNLEDSYVEDIGPLAGLPLSTLKLPASVTKNVDILLGLPLRKLYIHYSFDGEEEIIGQMTDLELLSFCDYACDSLEPLQDLDRLRSLDVAWSPMKEMKGFSLLPGLRHLAVNGGEFSDLSELRGLSLIEITLEYSQVMDFSFVKDLPRLRYLSCDTKQAEELYKVIKDPPFEVEVHERIVPD